MSRARILAVCALSLSLGCTGKKTKSAEPGGGLVAEAEKTAMRDTILAAAKDNAERICLRPFLRPVSEQPGSADDHILALLVAAGESSDCAGAIAMFESAQPKEDGLVAVLRDAEGRARPVGKSSGLGEDLAKALAIIEGACQDIPAALALATSHADACSPFLAGRRGQADLMPMIKMAKATLVLARKMAREGNGLAAAQLLLDAIRFGHDMSRGGSSLLEPMIAVAMQRIVAPEIDRQLEELSPEDLGAIGSELLTLADSQPPAFDFYRGGMIDVGLYYLLPGLEPEGWQPPGGFPNDHSGIDLGMEGPFERDGLVLAWLSLVESTGYLQSVCPAGGAWRSCIGESRAYSQSLAEKASMDSLTDLLRMATTASEKHVRQQIRQQIMAILAAIAVPAMDKYFVRLVSAQIGLRALRSKARSRQAVLGARPCPAAFDIEDSDLQPLIEGSGASTRLIVPAWLQQLKGPEDSFPVLAHNLCGG